MLDEFRTLGLSDAARRLGCDPFDLVKLLVASGRPGADLRFDAATLDQLRLLGRMEDPWWAGVALPVDASVLRARCRAAVQLLHQRGHVGEHQTRLDNVLRGLGFEEQGAVRRCLTALAEDGVIAVAHTPIGPMVSIPNASLDKAKRFVAGNLSPAAFQAALEG
jgi:hypothetical protein